MMSAPLARASRAVSSPMPELPPITTTVCPSRPRSRCAGDELIEAVMVPPDAVAHVGSSVPVGSAVMDAVYQPGQLVLCWWCQESPWRVVGGIAPGRHPGTGPGVCAVPQARPRMYALL